jgi:hypothetical protein
MKAYLLRVAIALDQLLQALCNKGILGITISARAATARKHAHAWGCVLCRFLDWLETDHCELARRNDIKRAHAVIESLEAK